ncbi:uncharacterized protein LOC134435387 isoform X2 [Engraulis encrasicolus]|uniref:uncharacterized protein LOC134435387 isoform X2 n=1 Tax=Engraulis encrasicolus TaxID=184585 RepID=UPI002FD762DB
MQVLGGQTPAARSDYGHNGNASGTTERSSAAQKPSTVLHKHTGWHNVGIDPYDGSSEDSCTSVNDSKRPKKGTNSYRFWGKSRRGTAAHGSFPRLVKRCVPLDSGVGGGSLFGDIHMLSGSDDDLTSQQVNWPCDVQEPKVQVLEDSGISTRSLADSPMPVPVSVPVCGDCTPSTEGSPINSSLESSHDMLFKRKLFLDTGYWHRKRRCVTKTVEDGVILELGKEQETTENHL